MKARSKLVWKLTAMVVAILTMAILLSGIINNRLWNDYALASTHSLLRFNTASIVKGIGHQMMSRNKDGVDELIDEMARDTVTYRDIRLLSHHSGKVVASGSDAIFPPVSQEAWACAVCHEREDFDTSISEPMETIIDEPDEDRVLSVLAPVENQPRCSTAECHAHANDPPILAFVNAEYSLRPMDTKVAERKFRVTQVIFASLLLGIVASWFMFGQLLERPIRELIAGTKRIAAHQLDFRFDIKRRDEVGALQHSFNTMTATIQASHEELREAKEYLEGLIEHSADIIITVNADGLIETFNREGEEVLGYRREEVIGQPIESLYVDPRERADAAARLEQTGNVKNYETRLRGKDGRARNVLLTLSRLRDSEGNSIGTIGISKDITHEKALQDELRDAKEYLEAMVENSADIIISVNRDGLIQTFNHGGERALGYGRDEVIGRPIESLFVDPRERSAAIARLKGANNVRNFETRFQTKDGRIRNVLLTLSRLRDSENNPLGTLGISKDITQERELQRELVQSQKLAAIGQAVTGIQHAIKNMLNSLKGGTYMVHNGMKKDNQEWIEDGVAMVEEGIERISTLSRNMLNIARDCRPDLHLVDVDELVANVCELNRHAAQEHKVILSPRHIKGLPGVLCDPKLIHMAITDIVVNAIDACAAKEYEDGVHPEVVLECSLENEGEDFVIQIRDNGCGMNDAVRQNIFTPFFSTKEMQGTGLGLAVTAKIITVHEGTITVESEPDCGTTFRIHIPKDGPRDRRGDG